MNLPPEVLAMRHVPTIGKAFTILDCTPTVLIRCECVDKIPILLAGGGIAKKCKGCGKSYMIAEDKGQVVAQVKESVIAQA